MTLFKKVILALGVTIAIFSGTGLASEAKEVQFWGNEKLKYDNNVIEDKMQTKLKSTTTLGLKQKPDDKWSWVLAENHERTYDYSKHTTKFENRLSYAAVTYTNKDTEVKFGRDSYTPAYGLNVSSEMTGLKVGHKIDKLNLAYYRGYDKYGGSIVNFNGTKYPMSSDTSGKDEQRINIEVFEAGYKFDKKWETKASRYKATLDRTDDEAVYWEVGAKYKANRDWSFLIEQGGSSAAKYNRANAFFAQYKGADAAKPGTYGVRIGHYRVDKFAALDTNYTKGTGHSVWGARWDYAPAKDTTLRIDYFVGDCTDNDKKKLHGYAVTANYAF